MKKYLFYVVALVIGATMFTSCSDDDSETITYYTVNFEETYFSDLIDNPQYGGALIYSADEYKWEDKETTLSSTCEKADWTQWGMGYGWDHGIAISNYVDPEANSYDKQLSVPVKGTKTGNNFAIVWDNNSELVFADGEAHTIMAMDVCNTSYALANIKKNLAQGYEFKVICTVYKADGTTVEDSFFLAKDDKAIEEWATLSLAQFGPIKKIVFSFDGTDKTQYGVATPKYFAIDNIIIRK